MNRDAVAENLERAADYLRMNGHVKGRLFGDAAGGLRPACAIGAIRESATDVCLGLSATAGWAAVFLAQQVGKRVDGFVTPALLLDISLAQGKVVTWNDHRDTTAEQVVDLMLETAKDLRNGEVW